MTSKLTTFLTSIDAQLNERDHCSFNSSDSLATTEPEKNFISPLTHYGFLAIDGPDTSKFLQGQTTCNISEVNGSHGKRGACCSPKGRVISSFLLGSAGEENFILRMRRKLVDITESALSKYIVFSKAKQTNTSDEYIAIGLSGTKSSGTIGRIFGRVPNEKLGTIVKGENIAVQLDEEGNCFECWMKIDTLEELWSQLAAGFTLQGSKTWELLTIRLGLGEVDCETTESFIPQMLNYHTTGAISFTKGCYTGQEVVARMQYKGKLKKHMYHIYLDKDLLRPGDDLYSEKGQQSIGKIVNIVNIDGRGCEALAVITEKHVTNDDVFINTDNQNTGSGTDRSNEPEIRNAKILTLPYAI